MRNRSNTPFRYRDGELFCEAVAAAAIAEEAGTPVYVYSAGHIVQQYHAFERALGKYPHLVCYAAKANSNRRVMELLAREGAGFDIVSGGELALVVHAGGAADRVVFSGVGKTATEIDDALRSRILLFNCESESELRLISDRASRAGRQARVALRVNPQVNARTHPYITTGLRQHKFGIEMKVAERLYHDAQNCPGIQMAGLSCHIGSQIDDLAPFEEAVTRVVALAKRLRAAKCNVEYIDVGGGLAVAYRPTDKPPSIADYCRTILRCVRGSGLQLLLEPGRALVAEAGILLTRVIHTKSTARKNFIIVDAAMNDLIRPSLYGAHHEIRPVVCRGACGSQGSFLADIVGPVCETGDFLARNRPMPPVQPGDLLAVFTAGAYGYVLSSNYNARPRPAEVLVEGNRWRLARRRETMRDLMRGE